MLILNIFREFNRVNNERALFEVRSPIKLTGTPCSGLGKLFKMTG